MQFHILYLCFMFITKKEIIGEAVVHLDEWLSIESRVSGQYSVRIFFLAQLLPGQFDVIQIW